ncbi:cytochrome P450 [Streptomyces sulfonofaciens]|uniref:Cytochrome P450 n=1 Tax=Streptomyces sulfonofaciens TaxID=68272 RepID=A0A919GRB5_9ACTN|nr:cytochrome P450 [Streptomyces sulfonofaciens]GHH88440.1 cytochrome P450 [Streptomyces sulfonofaciens]
MSTEQAIDGYPVTRQCPFHPPAELTGIREESPVTRMTYPDGTIGWLVTGYALGREVFGSPAFSSRHDLRSFPVPMPLPPGKAVPGMFIGMDPPDHTRYRRPLSKAFTVRRVRDLEPRIERVVDECLDAMEAKGGPVDLMQEFAVPVPVRVISELLGAAPDVAEELKKLRVDVLDPDAPRERAAAASRATSELMLALVRSKRTAPGDDLLSALVEDGELTDAELAGMMMLMLIAGHETTAQLFGLSAYLVLEREPLRKAVVDGPVTDATANEFLRYLSVAPFIVRVALKDTEVGGARIAAGESVTISLTAANRDPERFADPDTFEVEGPDSTSLAFGHGLHQCIGQNLARTELRIGLPALLRRFPALRLAAPREEIRTRDAMHVYGVHRLPVTW